MTIRNVFGTHVFAIQNCLALIGLLSLVGCASDGTIDASPTRFTNVTLENEVDSPSTPPRIIGGQRALVTYTQGDNHSFQQGMSNSLAEAWSQTGLFSDVKVTEDQKPSVEGFYVTTHCNTSNNVSEDGVLGGMFFLMSAAALPHSKGYWQFNCQTTMYQNGTVINRSNADWIWPWFEGGWAGAATLSDQEKIEADGRRSATRHMVNRSVYSLKKAYP